MNKKTLLFQLLVEQHSLVVLAAHRGCGVVDVTPITRASKARLCWTHRNQAPYRTSPHSRGGRHQPTGSGLSTFSQSCQPESWSRQEEPDPDLERDAAGPSVWPHGRTPSTQPALLLTENPASLATCRHLSVE